jgi:hypothetical protein
MGRGWALLARLSPAFVYHPLQSLGETGVDIIYLFLT